MYKAFMLNCVNSLGQPPQPESSALIEEKPPIESCRSSRGEMSPPNTANPIPPPPVPFSIPPYPPRFLDDNAV
ncbi:unnamed protein product [Allacma fusca]|uniref:Uncharacterized protein n=1 Tax=Allacma fusca TaxID=39272 RepID=A0A8J2NGB8_9HEXA|nr:unnamed protein product [Allacma fusca]